jgi:hypothetical protein
MLKIVIQYRYNILWLSGTRELSVTEVEAKNLILNFEGMSNLYAKS